MFYSWVESSHIDTVKLLHVFTWILPQRESFGLYALYSKNKPQSDALILHRRHDIFKVSLGVCCKCSQSIQCILVTLCLQYNKLCSHRFSARHLAAPRRFELNSLPTLPTVFPGNNQAGTQSQCPDCTKKHNHINDCHRVPQGLSARSPWGSIS